jgi:hypothetical protein
MDDVISPTVETQPGGAEPTAPSQDGGTQSEGAESTVPQGQQSAPERDWQKENENLKKALQQERDRYRQRMQQQPAGQGEVDETLYNNPEFQKAYLENATYKLKEGVKSVLDQYPNLPKAVANAITRNPRGFVNDGTTSIEQGLWDIEDYINEVLAAEQAGQPVPQPKPVQVAATNAGGGSEVDEDAELQAIADIPPEEWTKEQEAQVNKFMKAKKAK